MVENLNSEASVASRWFDRDVSFRAQLYIFAIIATGGTILLYSLGKALLMGDLRWIYLAVLTALASLFSVRIPVMGPKHGHFGIAMGDVFIFTSILLFGPPAAVILAAVEGTVISIKQGCNSWYRQLFNVTHLSLTCFLVAHVFYWMQGGTAPPSSEEMGSAAMLLLLVGICGLIYFALNTGIVVAAMSLTTGQPFSALWQEFVWASVSHFSCASLGAVIFLYFGESQFYYVALATPMLLLIYYTYRINVARFTQTRQHLTEVRALLEEKIEAEKELQKAKDLLEIRVEQRTSELREANQQLLCEVNERNAAQRALARETERLRVTLRSIGDGVVTTDIEGRVVLMNDVAEVMTGWSSSGAALEPLERVFRVVREDGAGGSQDLFRHVLETGEIVSLEGPEQCIIARDGSRRTVAHTAAPIRGDDGNISGVVLVFRDITEQQRLERELLRAQKLESLGLLAGGIAHDFNNILGGILLKTQLAQRALAKQRDPGKFLGSIQEAVQTATALTQQLLTFAKGGAPIKQTASVRELLQSASSFALRGSSVRCQLDLAENLWCAEVDTGQVSQVVHNLVINAAQSMPEGGTITIAARNVALQAGHSHGELSPGNYIQVAVQDEGCGISAEDLGRIFDPYFTTKPTGHGLGLTTTHSIIQKHGGHIAVHSAPGEGSRFDILLPASMADAVIVPETPRENFEGSGRVLIMDDEPRIREALAELLEDLGYEAEAAADGSRALEKYQAARRAGSPFDVVIMDLTIPGGMGGREAVQRLLAIDPQARAVVYSGYSKDPVMASHRKYGFRAMLTKPFRFQEVGRILAELIPDRDDSSKALRKVG